MSIEKNHWLDFVRFFKLRKEEFDYWFIDMERALFCLFFLDFKDNWNYYNVIKNHTGDGWNCGYIVAFFYTIFFDKKIFFRYL